MPVPKGGSIAPEVTRARLLDAALELFAARGVNAVGVAEVAAKAGASKLSLYRYFPSKDDLVAAVVDERSARVQQWLRRESGGHSGIDGVLAVFDLLSTWFRRRDFVGCAIINSITDLRGSPDPRVTTTARRHLQGYRDLLVERLSALDPAPRDVDALARQLLLLIEGATVVAAVDSAAAMNDARAAAASLIDVAGRA
ncbi:TetR/AcrR family transcriptional regulator [Pseudonocardia phyllosphaerae]|uniref:TetR/AcrR family transcriptional regulator n=1 Tax=Pseudonocardia phyllosphaerae TaxID=3390502 RepID=UPI003978FDC9